MKHDKKTLLRGLAIKAILTDFEIARIAELGIVTESDWDTAVLGGSRAYGEHREDSDIDIFFRMKALEQYSIFWDDATRQLEKPFLPSKWAWHKNTLVKCYEDSNVNIVHGRLNIITVVDRPDAHRSGGTVIIDMYEIWVRAVQHCIDCNGSKKEFMAFTKAAIEFEKNK